MTCAEYRASAIDTVFTMSTYQWWPPPRNCTALPHDCTRPNMRYFANKDIPALGNKFGFGARLVRRAVMPPSYHRCCDCVRQDPTKTSLRPWWWARMRAATAAGPEGPRGSAQGWRPGRRPASGPGT